MSKLEKAFADIEHVLHHNPSCRPFYMEVIAEHDALVARVEELEAERASDKEMMDVLRKEFDAMFPKRPAGAPNYIREPVDYAPAAIAAVSAAVPDDAASLTVDEDVDTSSEEEKMDTTDTREPQTITASEVGLVSDVLGAGEAAVASEPTPVPGAITGSSDSLSPQPDPQDAGATPAE